MFHDPFSIDTGMTGNDGEAVLASAECAVLLERQVHAAPTERVRAFAEKGHALSFGNVILHGLFQAFIRLAEQGLVLGQSFFTHDSCLSLSHSRSP